MFTRAGIRAAVLLGDLLMIPLALYLASWLRPQLEFGKPLPLDNVRLGWPVYLIVLAVWATVFLLMDISHLQKNLRVIDELQRLAVAHAAASLTFAGILYFSFRDTSRLQVMPEWKARRLALP